MTHITPPSYSLNAIINGDIDIESPLNSENGTGTIHIKSGGLYVEGLTDLDETTISTNDGPFTVQGTNKILFDISGGATSSIEMTAEDASLFETTTGTLSILASNTSTGGKINIKASGTGTDSLVLEALNATDGQVTVRSAGASSTINAIRLLATDTVEGDVLIQGSGDFTNSNPSVLINADNTGSAQIKLLSAGNSSTVDAVYLHSSNSTNGNVLIKGSGTNANKPGVTVVADNTTSGQVFIEGKGDIAAAVRIYASHATTGGIDVDAVGGPVTIDTTNTATGVTIATATAGVPVTIGTASSLTTIEGNLVVQGTTVSVNTETLTIEDNVIVLNSGNGELDLDSGVIVRRFQDPNATGTGNVVSSNTPIQESGAFQSGSATPGSLKLAAYASSTTDFYKGWWIKVLDGDGIDQVRRIKSYDGTTKVATIYVTADNVNQDNGPGFVDGLDLVDAPASGDLYNLYNNSYAVTYYKESSDSWAFANTSVIPNEVSVGGASTIVAQNYQEMDMGSTTIRSQVYKNMFGSASTTTITFTLKNHGVLVGHKIHVTDSTGFTPAITTGQYTVTGIPTANTFTITVGSSTTSTAAASATVTLQNTSSITVNVIEPLDTGFTINIPGLAVSEDIIITKTSTANFPCSLTTTTYGAILVLVADLNNTDGAFSVFAATKSTATGAGTVSRLVSNKGAQNQRIDAIWDTGANVFNIRQTPAGSGGGTYTYRVRVLTAI